MFTQHHLLSASFSHTSPVGDSTPMTLIGLIVVLLVVGFAAWLIMQIQMPPQIRTIIIGIIIFVVVLWLISAIFPGSLPRIPLK